MANLRLLPRETGIGWTPYAWLVYLGLLFVIPAEEAAPPRIWAATAFIAALFTVLYLRSYWVCGTAKLAYVAAMTAIGMIVSPFNPNATTFFVYAAGTLAWALPPSRAYVALGGFLAIVSLYSFAFHQSAIAWAFAVLFSGVIGATSIRSAEVQESQTKLRLAHGEVERLAAVAERERIARDLHDVLGHTLSVIVLKSELAARFAERGDPRAANEIADVEKIARESLGELREAIAGYRSSGLVAEVARARDVLETAGVRVECELDDVELSARQEGVLALALREAVTNVVRHARADSCRLRIVRGAHECRLEIDDDGTGGASVEGSGLAGMRERVESLGGTLVREIANGTRLVLTLPLGAAR